MPRERLQPTKKFGANSSLPSGTDLPACCLLSPDFIQYLQSENVKLTELEKKFSYMVNAYKNFFGTDLDVYHIPAEMHEFLKDNGKLCDIRRSSTEVRDKHLLKIIEQALKKYERIFMAFGAAHAVAIEPALNQILKAY